MQSKFLSLLGMARKANRIRLGYDKAVEAIYSGAAYAVFCAADISEKTKRGLVFASEDTRTDIISVPHTIFDISSAVGSKTGIVAVCDAGFAKRLCELAGSEQ